MAGTHADVPSLWLVRGAVALALVIDAIDGLAWMTGFSPLSRMYPHWPHLTPWSAALLAGLGSALLVQCGQPSDARVRTGRALAVVAGTFALVFLAESATGWTFGLDRALLPGAANALQETSSGRPIAQAAFSILALAGAVALVRLDRRWVATAWPLSIAAASALPVVALVTYLFDAAQMMGQSPAVGMNASTAAAIALLAGATVAARPDRQPVAWLVARPDRRMLVRLVVTFLLVPVWVAICRLVLLAHGLRGDAVWVQSIALATVIVGVPFFIMSRRVQRLIVDRLAQSRTRLEAERLRAEAVEQYRILADNAVDVVVRARDRELVWVSPSIEPAFGWPVEQWVGTDFVPRIHPTDLEAVFAALAENAQGRAAVARFRVATADGGYRWVEGHGKPYTDIEGNTDGVIVALRTIDAQVAVERELQQARDSAIALAEEKSDYVATVSHEIRSPIHAIAGFSELLEKQLAAAGRSEAAEWSRRIRTEAERLTRLIEDLLDLSRLDAGRTKIASEPFQLRKTVDDIIQMSRLKAEVKGLKLDYSVDPTIADWRLGDADRLHQVLRNLVDNAWKFTREGRIDLEVSPAATSDEPDLVKFAVTDTGPGIPGEEIDRILQPFAQVWGSDADQGSGLGLAISDRLVKAMGGEGLGIASLEGHGSTFHFTVPLPQSQPQEHLAKQDAEPTGTSSTRTILVVDDNPTNRLLVEAQLKKLGYDCALASHGAEALDLLENERFDAILMDCNMPVMDGYEATRRIRARERGTGERIPVLALTASASNSNRDACERAGMDGFLSKPILLSNLAEMIGRFFRPGESGGDRDLGNGHSGPHTSQLPILDHTRIDRLLSELGAEPLQKVVTTFVEEMPRRLAELRRVAAQRDAEAVRRSAHAIRSPSAMLGAVALAEQLRAVEEAIDPVSTVAEHKLGELIDASIQQMEARLGHSAGQGEDR